MTENSAAVRSLQYLTLMRIGFLALLFLAGCSRVEPILLKHDCRRTEVLDVGLLPERVKWVELEDKNEDRTQDLWCTTIGPAVLRKHPTVPDSSIVDSVVVVSWNTHVGGGDIERFVRNLKEGRFTEGDSVKHFVLLLQEVYRASDSLPPNPGIATPSHIAVDPPNGKRRDIVTTASTLGLSLLYVPSMRNGTEHKEDRGNAILSTFALHDPEAIELPFERQRRVVAAAEIEGKSSRGEWKLKLATTHFDNTSRKIRITASAGAGRYRQAHTLVDELADDEPVVVAGDFNTWAMRLFEKAVPLMREHFDDSPDPNIGITYVKGRMRSRLDYMFFKLPDGWSANYERVGSQYGSDHYPLIGWVKLGRMPSVLE